MNIDKSAFSAAQLESICKIIADTEKGLTGSEISYLLDSIQVTDINPDYTKWKRVFNALSNHQNKRKTGEVVLTFVSKSLKPERYINRSNLYKELISEINKILLFRGLIFKEDGKYHKTKSALTLSEAESRAANLKTKLQQRNVHSEILKYCVSELIVNNYFHSVLEACKSIAVKIRQISGLHSDGAKLIDEAFGGKNPKLLINSFDSETKKSEQRGFVNLAKGFFGTFRNPTAHDPKIEWDMTEDEALDIFVLASYIYKRIDRI